MDKKKLLTLDDIIVSREDDFKSQFWLSKLSFIKIYLEIYETTKGELELKKLLLFLNFIKCYPTLKAMSSEWDLDPKTIKKYILEVVDCYITKFSLDWPFKPESRLLQNPMRVNNLIIYSVIDTSLFLIQKPSHSHDVEKQFFSVKHQSHGIKLEVAVNVSDGLINWVSKDYYEGSVHDISISRDSGVLDRTKYSLVENERILADLGYVGEEDTFAISTKGDELNMSELQKTINKIFYQSRVIVENVFGYLKRVLYILKMPFRGDIDEFGDILVIILYILNFEIKNNKVIRKN